MKIRHTGIVTQNIEEMYRFYQSLGLKVISDTTEQVRIVKLSDGEGVIELLQYESQEEAGLRRLGISHVAFTQDVDGNYIEGVKEC